MKNVKRTALINSLRQINGNAIGKITTNTTVKLTGGKKNPLQGRVTKISTNNVMLFGNSKSNGYANMKNRRNALISKETGDKIDKFIPKKRPWGSRLSNTPLVFHMNKAGEENVYAEVIHIGTPKTEYFVDGKQVEKKSIEGMPKSKKTDTNEIILRTVNVDNITSFKCGSLSVNA